MERPAACGVSVPVTCSVFAFSNYYEAKGFASEHGGLMVERRSYPAIYRWLVDTYLVACDARFLVLLDMEVQ